MRAMTDQINLQERVWIRRDVSVFVRCINLTQEYTGVTPAYPAPLMLIMPHLKCLLRWPQTLEEEKLVQKPG